MSVFSGLIVSAIGYSAFFLIQALFTGLMILVTASLFRGDWIPAGSRTSG
jgi:hypothetical protein